MATSAIYLIHRKCWLKLHSNLKEGKETADKKAEVPGLGGLPLTTATGPSTELPEGGVVEVGCWARATLLDVWQELSHLNRGRE